MKIDDTKLAAAVTKAVRAVLTEQLKDMRAELQTDLERVALGVAEFRYCGVWREGQAYKAGNFVTHNGSLWHCDASCTDEKPGGADKLEIKFWTLAVKSGKA